MKNMKKRVEDAIIKISKDFKRNRALFLSESDMKCKLYKLIDKDETYISNNIQSYIIRTEVGLTDEDDKVSKRVDILITKFDNLRLSKTKWRGDRTEEIGIELKFNLGKKRKELKSELEKDVKSFNLFDVKTKLIVCFDHSDRLTGAEVKEICQGTKYSYVNSKKIISNIKGLD